ncbi:hypothetical protein [Microbacterium sp. WCS2018Hpa-9]|uniref:hypothetical protein n=1 Tax=Microbacterium sp. WCS2018Hpa-9 TaxID=3073635 RepID=UPI00288C012E|nr:hypothetical protein [Microbacterium sp. WCS2018Hpa-9]
MIAIDIDQILAELKRIARDAQQFPDAAEVRHSEGGVTPALADFREAVSRVASGMGTATQNSVNALNDVSDAIRFAVTELAEQDASLADDTKIVLALLDSAAAQSTTPAPVPAGTTPATGGTSGADEPDEADY